MSKKEKSRVYVNGESELVQIGQTRQKWWDLINLIPTYFPDIYP